MISKAHLPESASPSPVWRRRFCALLAVLPFLGGQLTRGADDVSKEHQLKAAFLYSFTKFVVWPALPPRQSTTPFLIGVLGQNPFGTELEKVCQGRTVGGRPLQVAFVNSIADVQAVDLLFVPAGEEGRIERAVGSIHASAVLTVGETARFAKMGGIITFSMSADRIRFEINREAGFDARLKISPQLLKLSISARQQTQ